MDVDDGRIRHVTFSIADDEIHYVPAYGSIYGQHVSTFVFGKNGSVQRIKASEDRYTGVSQSEVRRRIDLRQVSQEERAKILRKTLLDGATWETHTVALIAKISPKKLKQKRIESGLNH